MLPIVAIVGKPNVGKSTLFNRILGEKKAVTSPVPHTTRDRLYEVGYWGGIPFVLVDTGGFTTKDEDPFQEDINLELKKTLEEADKILFVVDAKSSITSDDLELAQLIRDYGKKVILVVNKVDNFDKKDLILPEFFSLGFTDVIPISAYHGINVDELLDKVIESLSPIESVGERPNLLKVILVGNVNVGKSSLFNRLLGKDRSIVKEIAGTTRDTIEEELDLGGESVILIDSAGIRRRWREGSIVEKVAVSNTLRAVNRADLAILVLDIQEGLTNFDKRITQSILEMEKPIIVVWNKIDLLKEKLPLPSSFPLVPYVPVCYTSCLTGKGIKKLKETILSVINAGRRELKKRELDSALAGLSFPGEDGKMIKVYYGKQIELLPPKFLIFVNSVRGINERTYREVEKRIRNIYPFLGNPIRIEWRES
ncbi:MAG: ribosome biogenesis GTPase Der [bacterium]